MSDRGVAACPRGGRYDCAMHPPFVPAPAPAWRSDTATIGLVGFAHGVSHFSQLVLAPLFPALKAEFGFAYTELGALLTIFFVVSCAVQTASGFVVDRIGPRPVLFGGVALLALASVVYASATSYASFAAGAVLAGIGNGVFHPVDYTLLNRKVAQARLGHAYSAHAITGSLGWAAAPALMVPLAAAAGWRSALAVAAMVAAVALAVLAWQRERLVLPPVTTARAAVGHAGEGAFDFLRIPAVWVCFVFFLLFATVLSTVQTFAPEAARQLHGVTLAGVAACLPVYMLCSAAGMVGGGFLTSDPARCERVVGVGMALAASLAFTVAFAPVPGWTVPALFGAMGLASGSAAPSRDMLVKRSTPANASGRVFGVVYSGLDIGQAAAPVLFGLLMDGQRFAGIWIGIGVVQLLLVAAAFNVRRARRVAAVPA